MNFSAFPHIPEHLLELLQLPPVFLKVSDQYCTCVTLSKHEEGPRSALQLRNEHVSDAEVTRPFQLRHKTSILALNPSMYGVIMSTAACGGVT